MFFITWAYRYPVIDPEENECLVDEKIGRRYCYCSLKLPRFSAEIMNSTRFAIKSTTQAANCGLSHRILGHSYLEIDNENERKEDSVFRRRLVAIFPFIRLNNLLFVFHSNNADNATVIGLRVPVHDHIDRIHDVNFEVNTLL
jgi:hypothetical protein